jgi:guanine nucleotide-binding protein G(i) subunit alpha
LPHVDASNINHTSPISDLSPSLHDPTNFAKVLLLGAGGSGKSTLVRQIKLIHGYWLTDDEKLQYKKIIRSSTVRLFALLASECVPIHQTTLEWRRSCNDFVVRLAASKSITIERDLMEAAVALWRDPSIQEYLVDIDSFKNLETTHNNHLPTYYPSATDTKSLGFSLDDPAYHFLPSLDRIMSKGYSPTTSDILSLRIPTTGENIVLCKHLKFRNF